MKDLQLTPHFKLSEFTRSGTASKYHIDNTLDPNNPQDAVFISNLKALCENVLEPLRQHFNVPLIIGSGFRCPKLNSHPEVKGATNSQHLTGEAADIHIPNIATGNAWFEWMEDNLQFDQLIKEKSTKSSKSFWIHVSFKRSGTNRQQFKFLIKNN